MDFTAILDLIQRYTNTQNTTSSSYPTSAKTTDVNNTLNQFFILANQYAGNWAPTDDVNQTDYPTIYANLVTGQQDYSFMTDENGNQILDIYRVRAKDRDGVYHTLKQIQKADISDEDLDNDIQGTPTRYFLTANGIFLVETPNYDSDLGLEVEINRTPTYFESTDTTKKAGIPWVFHEYLALRPSYQYCLQKGLPQAGNLKLDVDRIEDAIKKYYSNRNRAEKKRFVPNYQNNK